MRTVFLFPGSGPYEALDNWVLTMGRHTRHEVFLARRPGVCAGTADCAILLTEAITYPQERLVADMVELRSLGVPFGVVHNHDSDATKGRSGIPPRGDYPSFCWTKRGQARLAAHAPTLLRQPVFPPVAPSIPRSGNTLVGTFGHMEPKKQTFEMNRWARKAGVPFLAVGPDVLAATYDSYLADLRSYKCPMVLHPWLHEVEELAPFVANCTHFLFVLTDSKKGTGGSPTSPRFAGLFNRPVIVVDDEDTFREDGYYVYASLDDIKQQDLAAMTPPKYDWSPDAYLSALADRTLAYWRR